MGIWKRMRAFTNERTRTDDFFGEKKMSRKKISAGSPNWRERLRTDDGGSGFESDNKEGRERR